MGNVKSLTRIFLAYSLTIAIGLAGFTLLPIWFMNADIMYPANYADIHAKGVAQNALKDSEFHADTIPNLYQYLLLDKNGKVDKTNMPKKLEKSVLSSIKMKQQPFVKGGPMYMYYQQFPYKKGKLVLTYRLVGTFKSPLLRKLMPLGDWTMLAVGLLIILLYFFAVSFYYAKNIRKQLAVLTNTAQEISEMNLAFPEEKVKIKEINRVLQSMYHMRDALNISLEKQWTAEKKQKEAVAAIVHDTKTPLSIIKGNIDLLNETTLDEEQQDYVYYIEQHSNRVNYYVDQLKNLDYVASERSVEVEVMSGEQFAEQVTQLIDNFATTKEFKLIIEKQILEGQLMIDIRYVLRAIENILSNANSFMKKGDTLYLSLISSNNRFKLTIIDSGPGFSPQALVKAKEKFYMEDISRHGGEHFGMGLSIADKVMATMHGELHISNSKIAGQGAEVSLIFPYEKD